ncbi:MAG: DUF294 nucleotidyltransferase-like domain-containing protein [Pseudomonadota bacterium]
MDQQLNEIETFLSSQHPYDTLSAERRADIANAIRCVVAPATSEIYRTGQSLEGLYIVVSGQIEVRETGGHVLSVLGPGNSFGERGLVRDGRAVTSAHALADAVLYLLPVAVFKELLDHEPSFARFYRRARPADGEKMALTSMRALELMGAGTVTCAPGATVLTAARLMRDNHVSSILAVDDGALVGLLTTRDLTNRVVAEGLGSETLVSDVVTRDPLTLTPDALGIDVLLLMLENGIGHVPIVEGGRPVGMLTQTDLTRYQAMTAASVVLEVTNAADVIGIATAVARIPELLAQLVGSGQRHHTVTRLITDIGDAATRRLLVLAEGELGPAPVPYLWLACGSQGRQEQTGVSDQDNCLFLDDAVTEADMAYFARLAAFVSDGLDACGYYFCPGEMMATNPRWCQPVRIWREYFRQWVDKPDPMAQMLASVMFDLRPVAGTTELFDSLQAETLAYASANSIFVAHLVGNSLKHAPPLSMFRGLSTIGSGAHKGTVDLKLNGVVPVVDLGRVYALQGKLTTVNTRARIVAASEASVISQSGGRDLLHAYDVIATARLTHQAKLVRSSEAPDNFMQPRDLSDLERSHLRDAFVVVKTMQSALGQGRSSVL